MDFVHVAIFSQLSLNPDGQRKTYTRYFFFFSYYITQRNKPTNRLHCSSANIYTDIFKSFILSITQKYSVSLEFSKVEIETILQSAETFVILKVLRLHGIAQWTTHV